MLHRLNIAPCAKHIDVIVTGCRIQALRGVPAHEPTPLGIVGVAAASAGIAMSVLTTPQHRIKILQQSAGGGSGISSKRVPASVVQLARTLGLRGLYVGWGLTALCESLRGVYMMTYVATLRRLEAASPRPAVQLSSSAPGTPPASLANRALAGALAGIVGWACIFPIDSVKTVLMAQQPGTAATTAAECLLQLLREGGVPRLFRGLSVTLFRAGPVSGVLLPTFDLSLAELQSRFGDDASAVGSASAAANLTQ